MPLPAQTRPPENRFLYMLKGLACILVVFIHVSFPGKTGVIVQTIARFAVPMFFVISGRYAPSKQATTMVVCKQFEKLLTLEKIAFFLLFVYTAFSLAVSLHGGMTLSDWLHMKYNATELLRWLMVNSSEAVADYTYFNDVLWYLFAAVYVQGFVILSLRWRSSVKQALCVLLMGVLFLCQYTQMDFHVPLLRIHASDMRLYRNWLLTGIPFTLLGMWIAQATAQKRPKPAVWLALAAIGTLTAFWEVWRGMARELPLGIGLLVLSLGMLAECYPRFGSRTLAYIGRHLSANVYYWHVLIAAVLRTVTKKSMADTSQSWIFPCVVLALTLLLAFILHKGNAARLRKRMQQPSSD